MGSCGNCSRCNGLVVSSSLVYDGNNLIVNIPNGNYLNNSTVCIFIAQDIPSGVNENTIVVIQVAGNSTLYQMRTRCGHNVYGDQICSKRVYCTNVATDTSTFIYIGCRKLRCTNHLFSPTLVSNSKGVDSK